MRQGTCAQLLAYSLLTLPHEMDEIIADSAETIQVT